jgi:hypothetical protein
MEVHSSFAKINKEFGNSVDRHITHPTDGPKAISFNHHPSDLCAGFKWKPIHKKIIVNLHMFVKHNDQFDKNARLPVDNFEIRH